LGPAHRWEQIQGKKVTHRTDSARWALALLDAYLAPCRSSERVGQIRNEENLESHHLHGKLVGGTGTNAWRAIIDPMLATVVQLSRPLIY